MKRYSLWVKGLVFFLAVVTALCVAVSGLGILGAESVGMYAYEDYRSWRYSRSENMAYTLADHVMMEYAGKQSGSPQWLLEQTGHMYSVANVMGWYELSEEDWYYEILDPSGKLVASTQRTLEDPLVFAFDGMASNYPVIVIPPEEAPVPENIVPETTVPETSVPETSVPETTDPLSVPAMVTHEIIPDTTPSEAAVAAETYSHGVYNEDEYYNIHVDPNTNEEVWVQFDELLNYQVNIGVEASHQGYYVSNGLSLTFMAWLFAAKYLLIIIAAVSLLLFAVAFILLMNLAGKDPRTGEANPRALNRLPLDIYLAAAVGISVVGGVCVFHLLDLIFDNGGYNVLLLVLLCGCGIIVATTDIGFFSALAAQFKVPGGFWWRHSLCGRLLKLCWKLFNKAWSYGAKFFRRIGGYIRDVFAMLPVIWKWIAAGGALGFVLVIICASTTSHWYSIFPLFMWCLVFAALVIYCGYSYGVIQKGIQRMKSGDLNEKINTEWLFGSFKQIAEDLNALADVVSLAAEKQLKAERMKTELITNVSHDIKTPLTSVINYVDLLQQPHTEEEGEQYLEVLSRQSQRLKKLVEDLMDMSKASSGAMSVNITTVDAVETVNQALGEFADKLEAANLTPVFRSPDRQLNMRADGRLTWRVLSNLLSNVVKYALPGTRVYVDLTWEGRWVICSIKNISREELNISAEELTERFVRGDASRNTEGSGLGLNIAQSLMQLQHGSMELTVDGDLFKVTLIFPAE